MFFHGADRGHQARVEEGFQAVAKLVADFCAGLKNLFIHGPFAGLDQRLMFGVHSRKSGGDLLFGIGGEQLGMGFGVCAKLLKNGVQGIAHFDAGGGSVRFDG